MNEKLVELALEAGAFKAELITVDQMVLSAEFRGACRKNYCGLWGKCWMCPPDVGEIESLMAEVRSYKNGLWYQTVSPLEDSFDVEEMGEAKRRHMQLAQKLEAMLSPALVRHLHLGCGGCGVCQRCSKADNEPCRFPEKAMASLEAYGVDVYQTTRSTQLQYINGPDTVTYFGVVLF